MTKVKGAKFTLRAVRDLLRFGNGYMVATQYGVVDDFLYSKLINATNFVAVSLYYSAPGGPSDYLKGVVHWTTFNRTVDGYTPSTQDIKVDSIDDLAALLDQIEKHASKHE